MARVAKAYVEILPDLGEFAEKLRAELLLINEKLKVKVEPDTSAFGKQAAASVKASRGKVDKEASILGQFIGRSMSGHIKDNWDFVPDLQFNDMDDLSDKLNAIMALMGERAQKQFVASIQKRLTQRMVTAMGKSFDDLEAEQKIIARHQGEEFAEQFGRSLAGRTRRIARDEFRSIEIEAQKAGGPIAAGLVRSLMENFNKELRSADLEKGARAAADRISGELNRRLAGRAITGKTVEQIVAGFSRDLEARFGLAGRRAAAALARELRSSQRDLRLRPTVDTRGVTAGISNMLRSVSRSLGRYNFATVFASGLLGALATIVDTAKNVFGRLVAAGAEGLDRLVKLFEKGGEDIAEAMAGGTAKATQQVAAATGAAVAGTVEFGAAAAALSAETSAATGGVAALAGAMLLLSGGIIAVTGAAGLLQLVLGAILAVVIPLVGAVVALVAAFGELAAIGVGALGTIPAVLGSALAAFVPLMFVADKFQKLVENTATHTGELFVVVEKLKNAIFAVMTSGFVEAISSFADNTLPKLFSGIDAVASAWNRFLLGVVDLASAKEVIDGLNTVLRMGAELVDFFGRNLKKLLPALLTMATVGGGAFTKMLTAVSGLVTAFADWVAQMAATGQMQEFFDNVATVLFQIVALLPVVAELMGDWVVAILPAASKFLTILTLIFTYWNGLASSAEGQQLIRDFFESMNRIMIQLAPMLTFVVTEFMKFAPTLASLVEGARPAFEALVTVLFQLMRDLAPGLLDFLSEFAKNLSDPVVQQSLKGLVEDLTALMRTIGEKTNLMVFIALIRTAADVFNALAAAAQASFIVLIHGINATITVLNWAISAINAFTQDLNDKFGMLGVNIGKISHIAEVDVGKIMNATRNAGTSAVNSFDLMAGGLTNFANADAWQAIIDNSGAAANAINEMGRAAYAANNITDQATYEKTLARAFTAHRNARRVAKPPKADTSGISSAFNAAFGGSVGTALGGDTAAKAGSTAGKKTAAGFLSTLTKELSKLNAMDLVGHSAAWVRNGLNIAKYIAKGITSGSKNINKVGAYIAKHFPSAIKKVQKYIEMYKAAATPFVKELKKKMNLDSLNTLLDQIKDFKKAAFDALTPNRDLVGVFGFIPTPEETRNQLQLQLDNMRLFTSELEALQRKGLSKELAAAWLQAGAETAGNLVQGLQDATPDQIAEINKLYNTIGTEASKTADSQATAYYGVGQKTVEGYIKGIASMQTQAVKAIQDILDAALAAAKKKLGIKSPSSVFDLIGVNTVLGYVEGVQSKTSAAVGAVDDLYSQVLNVRPSTLEQMPTVRPGYADSSALYGQDGAALPPQINVRVYLGDKEITDILRTQVDNYDTTRARALLAGRRGG